MTRAASIGSPIAPHRGSSPVGRARLASLHNSPARARSTTAAGGDTGSPSGPRSVPSGSYPTPATVYATGGSPAAVVTSRCSAIRPSVSVPVLSAATTVTDPSVSTACSRRGIA